MPADWQLPPGVTRGLWDHLHDPSAARNYDASLVQSSLFRADLEFARRWFDRPGRLVDLGCGTGRLSIALARAGFWTLGVDLSEDMLRVTGEKATAAGVSVHRLKANLVELDGLRDESFDYAACLFSTLGMVSGRRQRRCVAEHTYRLLRPGGRFVLHIHNRWFNGWSPGGKSWLIRELGRSLLGRQVEDRAWPVHQAVAGFPLHLFTRGEAVRLLREVGFRVLEVVPLGLGEGARLPWPLWFGRLRAYGFLLAAERP